MSRSELDALVLDWLQEPRWEEDEARFDALAQELFAYQFTHCTPYRRFCEGRGATPATLGHWSQIPAVPTGAFKELALCNFPPERAVKTFRTSGTTGERRGELHLDRLDLYEASSLATFLRFLLPDLGPDRTEATILVLAPSPGEARDSSLSHMFGAAIREFGAADSRFFVDAGELRLDALIAACAALDPEWPLLLCGTSFAFVHLLDALEARGLRLELPPLARVMETGGFKGRSRSVSRPQLYAQIEERLDVPVERIVNQYGMTELASQFHDSVLREPDAPRRKLGAPWTRVRLVDPTTGVDVDGSASGNLWIYDLANTGSVLAIQTADLGRRIADGFEVLGREPGAEERGCSVAADMMLGGET